MTSPAKRPLAIAIAGTRGVPARYGGFETLAEELGARLAGRGHRVTVYCRSAYADPEMRQYRGMRLVVLPTWRRKHFDTLLHTFFSALHAGRESYDVVLLCNAANAAVIPFFQGEGTPVVLNVDGIERQRRKWGWAGQTFYRLSEKLAVRLADALVADAAVIQDYYAAQHGAATHRIAYGVEPSIPAGDATLARLGLAPRQYVLYVSRLEPENNPAAVVAAYRDVRGDLPLVMVGDAPYSRDLIAALRSCGDPRVLFPGAIYGDGYRELLANAFCYIQATEVGGTHPALVEALGYGNCVVYNSTPENTEVAGDAGIPFDAHRPETLSAVLQGLFDNPDSALTYRQNARERAARLYRWDTVVDDYETLLRSLAT